MWYPFLYFGEIWSFLMFFLPVIFYFRRSSAFYGLQAVSHPSLDSRLPVIPLWTPGYQSSLCGLQATSHPSVDSRLPSSFCGLQATSHPSVDSRLPAIRGLQTTSPLWTPGYQSSFFGDFRLPVILLWAPGYQSSFFGDFRYFVECLCLSCSSFILSIFLPHLWLSLAQLSPSLFVFHLGCL